MPLRAMHIDRAPKLLSMDSNHALAQTHSGSIFRTVQRAWRRHHVDKATPPRVQTPRAMRADSEGAQEPPPVAPQVGWLWDRKAAETKQRLREQNIRPKKSLGQNFMMDDDVLARIVRAADVQPGDLVLEIGPGTGNLTRHLLAAGAVVTAVEKDYALHDQLLLDFAKAPALRVVQGDILRVNLPQLLAEMQQHWREQQQQGNGGAAPTTSSSSSNGDWPVKVVANLPYNITKDCLLCLLPLGGQLSHLYFMLQDEVAVRLTGMQPGGPDWRVMNLITQYFSHPRYLFRIDRRLYHPVPQVDGAVVDFVLRNPGQRPAVPSERGFLTLVKKAFSQRRKVMRNSLQPLVSPGEVAAALGALGLNPDARAQDLSLDDFVALAWQLQQQQAGREQEEQGQEEVEEHQQGLAATGQQLGDSDGLPVPAAG